MSRRVVPRSDRRQAPRWWGALTDALGMDRGRGAAPPRYAARTRSPRRRPADRQAHRDGNYRAYLAGFGVIILILVAFLYVGVSWATGTGRTAALVPAAAPPPAAPPTEVPTAAPEPSPTAATATYVVKPGDTPVAIAQRYRIKVDDLLAANNITDPRALQVGQTLRIPTARSQ